MANPEVRTLEDLGPLKGDSAATPTRVYERKVDAKGRAYATGRRKDAVARVWVKQGPGKITVNGTGNDRVDFAALRKRIGYVSQDTQLFAGTIRENLHFVYPGATDEECLAAIHAAAADKVISRGGKGLETRIGEGGLKLSGGERQRIAIARALLRKPDLLIFDEATSALDSLTEREITDTIRQIHETQPRLAVVLVAHRLSTVAHADTIFVLERGKIVEQGSHGELLKKAGGLYAALWREQQAVGLA